MHILALDVGLGMVKAAVFETDTGEPASAIARVDYALDRPMADAVVVPAERLWSAVAAASRHAARASHDVHAVGLSCMAPALVLLDAADRPLVPICTHVDRRSRPSARQVWAADGEDFLSTTGNRPLPGGISALSWRQCLHDDPYLRHRVRRYLHLNGWLGLHMTGECAFDPANASLTGLFATMTDQRWSPHWCDYFLVDMEWLPEVKPGGTTLGTLRSQAAGEMGLTAGLPVMLGSTDIVSSALAADLRPGDLLQLVDATQVLAMLTDKPQPSPRHLTCLFDLDKRFLQITFNPVGAEALRWLHQLCFREQCEQEFRQQTIPVALERTPRATFEPAFLDGERLELEAHRAAFRDLTLGSERIDLLAALLESLRRRHREALQVLKPDANVERVFLSGDDVDLMRQFVPTPGAKTQVVVESALRGAARCCSRY